MDAMTLAGGNPALWLILSVLLYLATRPARTRPDDLIEGVTRR